MTSPVEYRTDVALDDATLNELFGRAWPGHGSRSFQPVLARSLGTVSAFMGNRLIGFVNLATDGGHHAFLLDPTVDPAHRRCRIGLALIDRAAAVARARGCHWLHVDYDAELTPFYRAAGFRESSAGVMRLDRTD